MKTAESLITKMGEAGAPPRCGDLGAFDWRPRNVCTDSTNHLQIGGMSVVDMAIASKNIDSMVRATVGASPVSEV